MTDQLREAAKAALEFMNADRRDNVIFAYLPVSVVDALRAALEAEHHHSRWNIDRDGDDLLICFGDHDKGEKCDYVHFVRAGAQPPVGPGLLAALEGLVEKWLAECEADPVWCATEGYCADELAAVISEHKEGGDAIANRGGLDLLYTIRKELGWNDKTSLDILPRLAKELRQRVDKAERERDELKACADTLEFRKIHLSQELAKAERERDESWKIVRDVVYELDWPEEASVVECAIATRDRAEKAEAEVQRLREALEFLCDQVERCNYTDEDGHKATWNTAYVRARAALKGDKTDG